MLPQRDQLGFLADEFFQLWDEYGVEPVFSRTALEARLQAPYAPRASVKGEGKPGAILMFVGDGPTAEAGEQLFTKIIEAMKWSRESVYIATFDRTSLPEEISNALRAEIDRVGPKVVVALGDVATAALAEGAPGVREARGKFRALPWNDSIVLMPTYHPAYLLTNPEAKKLVWEDMKLVVSFLEANP